MTPSRLALIPPGRSSASGASASASGAYRGSPSSPAAGAQPAFPPGVVVAVKALACELPHRCGVPLSRWSRTALRRAVLAQGLVAEISGTTIWRWLSGIPFVPGAIAAGSSPGTRRSPPRPGPSWICTRAAGRSAPGPPGVRPLRGREDEHPGAAAPTPVAAARGRAPDADRA
jgi:hypothetical protein